MSKITDAIRKLRESDRVELRVATATHDSAGNTITAVALQSADIEFKSDDSLLRHDKIVEIDQKLLIEAGLFAPLEHRRQLADQFRLIKRPLLDNASGRNAYQSADANLIMVTSAMPGDGKTFNCLNLAMGMASEKDKSVLLVDADVAKPHISELFSLEGEPGLIDLLTDDSMAVSNLLLKTNVPGLRILPAGRYDDHATELLASRRMADVVNTLSTTFPDRIVIFDSPPLLMTSESRVLAAQMGQIVLVVRAGHTPQEAVLEAIESLDQTKAISMILNQASRGFGSEGYAQYGHRSVPGAR